MRVRLLVAEHVGRKLGGVTVQWGHMSGGRSAERILRHVTPAASLRFGGREARLSSMLRVAAPQRKTYNF